MRRLNRNIKLDPRIKTGYYSDTYFNRTRQVLLKDKYHPIVRMQVFQRNEAVVCGIDEAILTLRNCCNKDAGKKLRIYALRDGDKVKPWDTVMLIEGDYSTFAHLETVYLGALARGTKIATNVYRCCKAANGKPILFFPARFDSYLVESKDGYSYMIGRYAAYREMIQNGVDARSLNMWSPRTASGGVSTDAQGAWWGEKGIGTIPHGLIAAYDGDTVTATLKFAELMPKEIKRVALVDFDNDCVKTTLQVVYELFKKYIISKDIRYKLYGVRLDTSGTMVDKSVCEIMTKYHYDSSDKPTGVTPELVRLVKKTLAKEALKPRYLSVQTIMSSIREWEKFVYDVKIIVSGGFNYKKIEMFERLGVPVDSYGVGSSIFEGNFDFTADIVSLQDKIYLHKIYGEWFDCGKKGRFYSWNPRLSLVKGE